jgi:protein-S-isoprenylcysteine O-methyltransferase Ste14
MTGTVFILAGTIINIVGRIQLKGNWANHIKIYENHSLIRRGVYCWVRHPLYSSIILMLYGGSTFYSNWFSAVLVSFVFIPAMAYRAKQEEQLLAAEFPDYSEYQQKVGFFFPKWKLQNLLKSFVKRLK